MAVPAQPRRRSAPAGRAARLRVSAGAPPRPSVPTRPAGPSAPRRAGPARAPASPAWHVRLVLWPALLSLAVTLLRLVGELRGWSPEYWSRLPGGGLSPLGIVWLIPVFGFYFGWRLQALGRAAVVVRSGRAPAADRRPARPAASRCCSRACARPGTWSLWAGARGWACGRSWRCWSRGRGLPGLAGPRARAARVRARSRASRWPRSWRWPCPAPGGRTTTPCLRASPRCRCCSAGCGSVCCRS